MLVILGCICQFDADEIIYVFFLFVTEFKFLKEGGTRSDSEAAEGTNCNEY